MTTAIAERKNGNVVKDEQPKIIYTPRIDIVEHENAFDVWLDMPGVAADAVDITLEKNILTVSGAVAPSAPEGFRLVHREYRPGVFRRALRLSRGIDTGNIAATMKHGVLQLTLPKAVDAQPRQITVTVEEESIDASD